ncbi:MAG: peptidase Ste24p [Bryobacterales bacterium]|jgi:peptidase M48-like protein|nr:peptidase Ste24p [Bryobacterales bacterium]
MKISTAIVLPQILFLGAVWVQPSLAQAPAAPQGSKKFEKAFEQSGPMTPVNNFDDVIDRAINRERILVNQLKEKAPVIETYIQEVKSDEDLGVVPKNDRYFLGKLDMKNGVGDDSFIPLPTGLKRIPQMMASTVTRQYFPRGFAYMMFVDQTEFDRAHYNFEYVRREFLGDVRCVVADVYPQKNSGHDRFEGRIWIEDEGYNVVRFNGVYVPVRDHKHSHFDSWRINAGPGLWLPSYIYTQEGAHGSGPLKTPGFRAQTRLWDYETQKDKTEEAFTNLTVDVPEGVKDQSEAGANDNSPVEQKRLFERQAEDNILDRLQAAGLVSPKGEVDQVLDTVLNNLMVTNNINISPGVRARILLTTPLESAPVGHTILLSRGLIDVLPDEACLAAVIAHELAHITLDHEVNTAYAFTDRLMFDDPEVLKKINVGRDKAEETAADQKAMAILKNSPYKDKLARVGLFLRMLSARSDDVPHLIKPLLGNRMAEGKKDTRLSGLMDIAPELQVRNAEQVAALPLGSRVRMNPWNDELHLMKSHNVALMSAKEKLPFEITPFVLHLTREPNVSPVSEGTTPAVNTSQNTNPSAPAKQ